MPEAPPQRRQARRTSTFRPPARRPRRTRTSARPLEAPPHRATRPRRSVARIRRPPLRTLRRTRPHGCTALPSPRRSRSSFHRGSGCSWVSRSPRCRSSSAGGSAPSNGDTRLVTERLALIDSNSLIYRAFFAVPPLTTTKGELANATFGFASILLKSLEQATPQHTAAAFDLPVPTFRREMEPTYKATRRPMPDELRPQFERCKQLLEAFGIPMYSLPGFEADDVIGALARQAEALGLETIIVSGDLDPLQLVTPRIKLMTTRQGFHNTVIYDEELIRQRYGLRPDQMVDFKALKGDATDNIPGVPGVGDKTAAKLIVERGNLEGVYADLGTYTPRLRESLAANKDQVFRSPELATIVTDLPVTLELDRTRRSTYDRAAVLELFRDLEFRSLVPRLPPADQNLAAPAPTAFAPTVARGGQMQLGLEPAPAVAPPVETALVADVDVDVVASDLRRAGAFAIHADADTSGRHPLLVGLGLAAGERAWYLPTPDGVPAPIAEVLRDEKIAKTAHDAKTARRALRRAGADIAG